MMANKADIVTLMKGNTPKYVRSHVEAVDGLNELLAATTGSVTAGSGVTILQQELTKINGLVNGNVMLRFDAATTVTTALQFFTLPTGFRPKTSWQYSILVDGRISFNVSVRADGTVVAGGRAYTGSTEAQIPAGSWIGINFSHQAA